MTVQELDLCDVQGNLFQLAATSGYDPVAFVDTFMQSEVAKGLDSDYNRLQWSGELYILHRLEEEVTLAKGGESVDPEALFWAGYITRYWHFATGESSRDIHATADAKRLLTVYPGYHTLDCDMAIRRLKDVGRTPSSAMDDRQLDFAVFCIENVAERLGVDGDAAFELLADKSDILWSYIIPCYEPLHTQGKDYIVDDIVSFMRERGVA